MVLRHGQEWPRVKHGASESGVHEQLLRDRVHTSEPEVYWRSSILVAETTCLTNNQSWCYKKIRWFRQCFVMYILFAVTWFLLSISYKGSVNRVFHKGLTTNCLSVIYSDAISLWNWNYFRQSVPKQLKPSQTLSDTYGFVKYILHINPFLSTRLSDWCPWNWHVQIESKLPRGKRRACYIFYTPTLITS